MQANQRRVFAIAYSVLASAADAEEVAQEVFLRAYRKFAALREPQKFRAWVGRIAFRQALNHQRSHRRQRARDTAWHDAQLLAQPGGAASSTEAADVARLWDAIGKLPGRLRAVLLLSIVADLPPAEVAEVLRLPAGTVRSRLHAARRLLLEAFAK